MKTQEVLSRVIGKRVKYCRKAAKMTQEELTKKLSFKNRQTLQMIEVGKRGVSADELRQFMRIFKKDFDFFTSTFLLVDEGQFSFTKKAK